MISLPDRRRTTTNREGAMKKSWVPVGVAAGLFGLGIAAVVSAKPDAAAAAGRLSGQEVRIGAIVPSSGPFAEWGKTNAITLQMLENGVNKAGGVEGGKLKIFIYDD